MNKIITIDEFKTKGLKKKHNKIVLAHGVFDLLHIGHLRFLKKAKSFGDCLVVSITNDENANKGINRPFFNENLRLEAISQLSCVDYVILSTEKTSEKIIKNIKPDIYVKGSDYKKPPKTQIQNYKIEVSALKKVNAKFKIVDDINFSSSNLINLNFDKLNSNQKKIFQKISINKKFNFNKTIYKKINEKIVVFGDLIIDIFIFTHSLGKSRKSNILSTRYQNTERYDGGSLMVLKILMDYFKNIHFLTCLNDQDYKMIKNKFKNLNIINIKSKSNHIINKTRFVDKHNLNNVFQINKNDQIVLEKTDEKKIINKIKNLSKKVSGMVITDFGHGLITEKICKTINKIKTKKFINCQANSSNYGFNKYTKYKSAHVLSCDEDEFRLSMSANYKELKKIIKENINKFKNIKNMIVTSGKQGSYLIEKKTINFVESLKINNMIDSIGCGDVYFAYLIIFHYLNKDKNLKNNEVMILCHLAASLHSKNFANSKLIDKDEFIKGFKSISA